MKKSLITLIGALALGATLPAFAGPDWQVIEQARKARQTAQVAMKHTVAGSATCPPDALALPLDHGPRAQTTPSQNQLRKERFEAQVKACANAAK